MGYTLEEQLDGGGYSTLGEPFRDVIVAKFLAARRAQRNGRRTVVREQQTGREVARYEGAARGDALSGVRSTSELRGQAMALASNGDGC